MSCSSRRSWPRASARIAGRRRDPRSPARAAASSRPTTCGTWTSRSCPCIARARSGSGRCTPDPRTSTPTSAPPATASRSTSSRMPHPTTQVRFTYASESDHARLPVRRRHDDRGWLRCARPDGERRYLHAVRALRRALERASDPHAGSGAVFDLGSNALRRAGWTSADAAGLPIFPGLVRWDEVQAGAIDHAIRFTADCTSRHYLWPARHQAGVANPRCPPMGARFRLKAGFKLEGFSRPARVILTAMKHYGLILADNGSDWYFQGEVNPNWTYALMDALKRVPAGGVRGGGRVGLQGGAEHGCLRLRSRLPAPRDLVGHERPGSSRRSADPPG